VWERGVRIEEAVYQKGNPDNNVSKTIQACYDSKDGGRWLEREGVKQWAKVMALGGRVEAVGDKV